MKKYLITSAAALALCGLITSCTHELDYEASVQSSVVKKYEDAFVTAFGKPDPNQEWGFGTSVVASRAMTRTSNKPSKPTFRDGTEGVPDFSKPENPKTANKFYETVALAKQAGINVVAAEGKTIDPQNNTTYSINSNTVFNNLQNCSGITLYVSENSTFSPSFSNNGNTIVVTKDVKLTLGSIKEKVNVYLASGAELELSSNDYSFNNNGSSTPYVLYLSPTSKITGSGAIQIDNGYKILNDGGSISASSIRVWASTLWNEGEIELTGDLSTYNGNNNIYNAAGKKITVKGKLDITNNNDLLYNNGEIKITGNITLKDGTTQIVNNGTLNSSGNLNMTAGGAFHNVGNATISGTSYIYNTNSTWMNDGHYTTGTFDDQNCEKVYNNCHMVVTGTFHLGKPAATNGHSRFVLDGGEGDNISGAYVKCNEFIYGGNTDLWLGNKSFIEVTNEFKNANYNSGYEVHGPTSGSYAVIKAGSFTKEGTYIKYMGNLYIDTPSHFDTGYEKETSVQGSCWGNTSPVSIPKTNCNPGYNNEKPSSSTVRVICEDLSVTQASDWDFNDVVFDVQLMNENTQVKITFLAAGGTLPLTVAGEEVHGLFKEANPDLPITQSSMINTGSTGDKYTFRNCKEAYLTINNTFGTTDVKEVAKLIPIQVYKLVNDTKTWVTIEYKKGEPAAKIAVGQDYEWCDERTLITDKFVISHNGGDYSKFKLYVKGLIGDNWYNATEITDQQAYDYWH